MQIDELTDTFFPGLGPPGRRQPSGFYRATAQEVLPKKWGGFTTPREICVADAPGESDEITWGRPGPGFSPRAKSTSTLPLKLFSDSAPLRPNNAIGTRGNSALFLKSMLMISDGWRANDFGLSRVLLTGVSAGVAFMTITMSGAGCLLVLCGPTVCVWGTNGLRRSDWRMPMVAANRRSGFPITDIRQANGIRSKTADSLCFVTFPRLFSRKGLCWAVRCRFRL